MSLFKFNPSVRSTAITAALCRPHIPGVRAHGHLSLERLSVFLSGSGSLVEDFVLNRHSNKFSCLTTFLAPNRSIRNCSICFSSDKSIPAVIPGMRSDFAIPRFLGSRAFLDYWGTRFRPWHGCETALFKLVHIPSRDRSADVHSHRIEGT